VEADDHIDLCQRVVRIPGSTPDHADFAFTNHWMSTDRFAFLGAA